jgi:hypothetical protein
LTLRISIGYKERSHSGVLIAPRAGKFKHSLTAATRRNLMSSSPPKCGQSATKKDLMRRLRVENRDEQPGLGHRVVSGAITGVVATGAMSATFLAAQRLGRIGRLPPEIIVRSTVTDDPRSARPVALVSHFGYGAAADSIFAVLTTGRRSGPIIGMLFGLGVWALSYEGWLPAINILPLAHRDARGRALSIIAAHLTYGAVLGLLEPLCQRQTRRSK